LAKRLFIAVDIDEATRKQVERISAGVREAVQQHTKASWVPADRMHLTLQFFGEADQVFEDRLRSTLARGIPEAPFDVSFDGLGFFPERGSPRVLWLGIREGARELQRVYAALGGSGSFSPHLTLARVRDRVPRGKLAGLAQIPASAGPSRIDRVTLYESRLSPKGSTYLPLATADLKP
jgi:2'-5' RNA ligase